MTISFAKSLELAPSDFVRVRLLEEDASVKRLVREGETTWLEIGIGKKDEKGGEMTRRKFITLCRSIINTAKAHTARKIAISFDEASPFESFARLAAENFEMANFEFTKFKTEPKEGHTTVEEILLCGPATETLTSEVEKGQTIGQAVNACRELAGTPGSSLTPEGLAKAAKEAAHGLPVDVHTLTPAEIEKEGMGLLAGVGKGSGHAPTFTIMEYKGSADAPIVLAGKGITFDSGGLNIKPSPHIYEMHMDMSGAAAVIHTVALAAKLKLPKHVIALIPAAENMLGDGAIRPGDILTSLSGKTVEVSDTDAEGRLVLADAITYSKQLNPAVVVDVATLTGAAMVALGLHASGLMSRDAELSQKIVQCAEDSGDYVWPLPLWDEYESVVKSDFADLINYPVGGSGKYGGAIGAGMFLWQFAKELDCPWAHLDIAPRMTSAPGDELAKGAAGAPVRLLISFIESWKTA